MPVVFCVRRVYWTLGYECLLNSSMTWLLAVLVILFVSYWTQHRSSHRVILYPILQRSSMHTQVLYVCTGHNFPHPFTSRPIPSHTPLSSWRSSSAVSTMIGYSPERATRREESEKHGARDHSQLPAAYSHTRSASIQQPTPRPYYCCTVHSMVDPGQDHLRNTSDRIYPIFSFFFPTPDSWTGCELTMKFHRYST